MELGRSQQVARQASGEAKVSVPEAAQGGSQDLRGTRNGDGLDGHRLRFGQRDLAAVRVGQLDRKNYDLRRGKTGVDRYGDTPPLVWKTISAYLKTVKRKPTELMFLTKRSQPLVHDNTDSVAQWWGRLREDLGANGKGLGGFYTLRHLGETEFGSRPGSSIGEMRRWLGHSASSQMADVYMKPVSPEDKPVVEWVRRSLKTGVAK